MSVYYEIEKVLIFYDYLIDTNINLCLSQLAIPNTICQKITTCIYNM